MDGPAAVGLGHRGGRDRLLVDLGDLLVPRPVDLDPGQVVHVVGGARGVLQVLDFRSLGRAFRRAGDGHDLFGVAAAGGAAPERTPAFHRGQGYRTRRRFPRRRPE